MYGIYDGVAKRFVYGICEPTKGLAQKKLFKKIGKGAYKWRFSPKKLEVKKNMDFSNFDKQINSDDMAKALEEAAKNAPQGEGRETPAGNYVAKIERMELKATKDGRPMFSVMLRVIAAGENAKSDVYEYLSHFKAKKPCLFMNRVIYGTKNDANMINSVLGWLNALEPSTEVVFKNYSQFSELIMDIFEELGDAVELDVDYDPNAFNSISINEVYDA